MIAFILGLVIGGGMGVSFTKAWHHAFLRDGFTHLHEVKQVRPIVDQDVVDAFGSGRVNR